MHPPTPLPQEALISDYTKTALLRFLSDSKRLLRPDSHFVNNVPLTVVKQPPKKKIPFDPVRLHVQGFKEGVVIKRDHIQNYLEKFCDVFVTDVRFGSNNLNALVVFDAEPGSCLIQPTLLWLAFHLDCSLSNQYCSITSISLLLPSRCGKGRLAHQPQASQSASHSQQLTLSYCKIVQPEASPQNFSGMHESRHK